MFTTTILLALGAPLPQAVLPQTILPPRPPVRTPALDAAIAAIKNRRGPCGIAGCDCGCRETGVCDCASKAKKARQNVQPVLYQTPVVSGGWPGLARGGFAGGGGCAGGS